MHNNYADDTVVDHGV